ncbi:MAG: hypothetical protein ABS79_01075 [Planctomycetes bacterium SCN 63-9]|nr:MAG: hypothetical protein ABS79_01075 [Planctomycetes bacterium SCN 63-9]
MTTFPLVHPPGSSTIHTVYRAVEQFQRWLEPTIEGPAPLPPLDAFVLHLLIDFCPESVFVADLACDATSGSTSVVCLANPLARRVAAATSDAPRRIGGAGLSRILEEFAIENFDQRRPDCLLPLGSSGSSSSIDSIRRALSPHEVPFFIIDAANFERAGGWRIEQILGELPGALIVVIDVGKVGDCAAAQRLVGECRNDSPYRLWRMAETSESLSKSRVCLIAGRRHPFADLLVNRIDRYFTTNFDFLDLVRDSCCYSLEKGVSERLDLEILQLRESLESSRQEIRLLREQLEIERAAPQSLLVLPAQKALRFARKHRRFFAPANSRREQACRAVMHRLRKWRSKAA